MALEIREVLPPQRNSGQIAEIDRIFYEASGRAFASPQEQDEFHERWLGRYLEAPADVLLVASEGASIIGYLVGALTDPADQPRFADFPYFKQEFRDLCAAYPAHLHINVAAKARGGRVGAKLIEAFADRAKASGVAGMHVVTGRDARNVPFYARQGFRALREALWNGRDIVFLGRRLPGPLEQAPHRPR